MINVLFHWNHNEDQVETYESYVFSNPGTLGDWPKPMMIPLPMQSGNQCEC